MRGWLNDYDDGKKINRLVDFLERCEKRCSTEADSEGGTEGVFAASSLPRRLRPMGRAEDYYGGPRLAAAAVLAAVPGARLGLNASSVDASRFTLARRRNTTWHWAWRCEGHCGHCEGVLVSVKSYLGSQKSSQPARRLYIDAHRVYNKGGCTRPADKRLSCTQGNFEAPLARGAWRINDFPSAQHKSEDDASLHACNTYIWHLILTEFMIYGC